jgi:hypothetical protein
MAKWFGLLFVFVVVGSLAMAVGFPWKQAALLAIFAAYVERGLNMAAAKPTHTFEPYWVWIMPNWHQILTDYTIVKNDEDWEKLTAWNNSAEVPPSHILKVGDWYSVLRNDKDGVLIYRGDDRGFRTAIDWTYDVTYYRFSLTKVTALEGFPTIDFFVKQQFDVVQLGLKVQSNWWKTFSADCPEPVETHEEYMFGAVKIVLAQLPLREFDLYWNEVDYEPKHVNKIWGSVRESRKKHGWEEKEKEKYMDFPSHWQPITIKNKYFEVQHRSIT